MVIPWKYQEIILTKQMRLIGDSPLHCQESGGSSQRILHLKLVRLKGLWICATNQGGGRRYISSSPMINHINFIILKEYSKSPVNMDISALWKVACCVCDRLFCPSWHIPSIPLRACDHFHTRLWCQTMWQKQLSWPLKRCLEDYLDRLHPQNWTFLELKHDGFQKPSPTYFEEA